jgi:hypothetical protein
MALETYLTGPNTVSVADPQALRQIHASHKFSKTSFYDVLNNENEPSIVSIR